MVVTSLGPGANGKVLIDVINGLFPWPSRKCSAVDWQCHGRHAGVDQAGSQLIAGLQQQQQWEGVRRQR